MDTRKFTLKLLDKTFENDGYSNIVLNTAFNNSDLTRQEKNFCSALYYGVIERKITLDHVILTYSKKKIEKLDMTIVNTLRCGIYQLKFMDSVPDNAAVNESVSLTKKSRLASASGFVNAVLRSFIRDNKEVKLPNGKYERYSVEYSAPLWLVKKLFAEYGEKIAVSVLESSIKKPPVTIRLNTQKCDANTLKKSMGNIEISENEVLSECVEVNGGDVVNTDAFKKGYFHVQDIASQFCCMALGAAENDRVIDICSAPGGKAFTIAEMMHNNGEILAFDLHEKRVKLISDSAKRLGLFSIKAMCGDALIFDESIPKADKILCDVPCSGLGVIRRKPEIKYKNENNFVNLPDIQYKILENAAKYLKIGSELVYSTCTLNRAENDDIIDKFLKEHTEFEGVSFLEEYGIPFGDYKVTLYPDCFNSDGFFISKIRKKGD